MKYHKFKFFLFLFLIMSKSAEAIPLQKVFGTGQVEYHQMVYLKIWKWFADQKILNPNTADEKMFFNLVQDCLMQVQAFSGNLGDKVDINYLRVKFSTGSTEVHLYCPDSILASKKQTYAKWFKSKAWTGNFWIWQVERNQIDNYIFIQKLPKQVDLTVLGYVHEGFDLAPFFFQKSSTQRLIFLKPKLEIQKYQVHPFADPDQYIILDEHRKSLEYSTKILIVENHPDFIKKLVYKFIDEYGIIPDRMFSTQNSLGLILP